MSDNEQNNSESNNLVNEVSSNEVSSNEVSSNEVSSNEVSSNEVSSNEVSSNEVSSSQSKPDFMTIVKKYITLLQIKMNKDDMIFLRKYHYDEYVKNMSDFVPDFKDSYPSLFQMIISGADLSMLDLFFEKFNDINYGKQTLNEARNELGNVLHNKYVKGKTKY